MKSSKVVTFEICEIFSNYYFSYGRDYKATPAGDNKTRKNIGRFSNSVTEENSAPEENHRKHITGAASTHAIVQD